MKTNSQSNHSSLPWYKVGAGILDADNKTVASTYPLDETNSLIHSLQTDDANQARAALMLTKN